MVVRPERDGTIAGHGVQRLGRRRAVRPRLLEPAVPAQPSVPARAADDLERLGHGGRAAQIQLLSGERPVQEVHVGVAERGQHAPPLEIDALVADRVGAALAHVDPTGDRVGRDRQRPHLREARVHRVDRPVVEDHGSTNLRDRDAQGRDRPQARGTPIRPRRRRPRRGAHRPAHRSRLFLGHEPAGTPRRSRRGRARAARAARPRAGSGRVAARADRAAAVARSARGCNGDRRPREREHDRPRARRASRRASTSATGGGCPTTSSRTARRPSAGCARASRIGSWRACVPPLSRCGREPRRSRR